MGGLLAATLVFAFVSSSLIRSESEQNARREFDRQAVRVATLISSQTARALGTGSCAQRYSTAQLQAFVGTGTRLFVTGLPPCPGGRHPYGDIPETVNAQIDDAVIKRDGFQHIAYPLVEHRQTVATAAPFVIRGQVIGHLILVKPREQVKASASDVAARLTVAAAIGFLPALLLTLLLTTRLTRPIRALREATDRVAAGDLEAEVARGGGADLDALADDFNVMVKRLRQREDASREFLMKVTHDLRTPLTAIRGHAAALADGVVPEEMTERSLAAIEGEATRLESMVTDLLDLARIDAERFPLDPARLDAEELLDRALDAHSADAAQRGVHLERQVERLPALVTDGRRMRQIVDNLLDNALRWTPDGGEVTLTATPRAGGVRITVSDTGPGVPEERREDVFTPFRSSETPDGRTGTGLGLAICRQLARALGGDVVVGDAPGGGARFVLTLPESSPGARAGDHPRPLAVPKGS